MWRIYSNPDPRRNLWNRKIEQSKGTKNYLFFVLNICEMEKSAGSGAAKSAQNNYFNTI
jgi:hypothetical protein